MGPDPGCEDELAAGDIVRVELDFEVFKAMHKEEHLWVEVLSKVVINYKENSHIHNYNSSL